MNSLYVFEYTLKEKRRCGVVYIVNPALHNDLTAEMMELAKDEIRSKHPGHEFELGEGKRLKSDGSGIFHDWGWF